MQMEINLITVLDIVIICKQNDTFNGSNFHFELSTEGGWTSTVIMNL